MTLAELGRPQWAATLHAARILRDADPADAEDKQRYRVARNRLVAILPPGADASDLIAQAARFYALSDTALAMAGMDA